MDEIMRMIYKAIALHFNTSGVKKRRVYIHEEEVQGDDPVRFPVGSVVKITIEFVKEDSIPERGVVIPDYKKPLFKEYRTLCNIVEDIPPSEQQTKAILEVHKFYESVIAKMESL